jgi:hypothetical protein
MTLHAEEEMDVDGFSVLDVERAVLTGALVGRQADREPKEPTWLSWSSSASAANSSS